MVKRIVAFGAVLLLTSACSRLPIGPTSYSSLPAVEAVSLPAQPVALQAVPAEMSAALPPTAIPGTLKAPSAESVSRGVNPSAVLEASMRAHRAWGALHPGELLKPRALATRSVGADVAETGATSAAGDPATGKPASAVTATLAYDREAAMDRLVKGGRDAAKAICSGC
jgi:hypothetical protein